MVDTNSGVGTDMRMVEESVGTATRPRVYASAGVVEAVNRSPEHAFTKPNVESIELVEGLGVEGDAHFGATVQHIVRVKEDPTKPNRRQVHLMHGELHDELAERGFRVRAGTMGENITTRGIALLDLPRGTRLHLGDEAIVEVTGLRTPCRQIERFQAGLLAAVSQDANGNPRFRSGIMGIVLNGGTVRAGDAIRVELPDGPHEKLGKV